MINVLIIGLDQKRLLLKSIKQKTTRVIKINARLRWRMDFSIPELFQVGHPSLAETGRLNLNLA